MKYKNTLLNLGKGVAITTLALTLSSMSGVANAKIIKIAHILPTNNPVHKSLEWFAKEVSKQTHLRLKVYGNGVLGQENDLIEMTQNGSLAFAKVNSAVAQTFDPLYKVLGLPYLFANMKQFNDVVDGPIGAKILASSEKDNFIGLAFLYAGSRCFYTKKAINSPADLKGMKIRVMTSPISMATMKALGATPVPLPYSELYSGLQQGVVDGAENSIPSYYSSRHYEVAPVYSYDKHGNVPDVLVVSTTFWNKLSKKNQAIIRKVAKETEAVALKKFSAYIETAKKDLLSKKIKFVTPDIAPFQKAVQPVYAQFIKDNPDLEPLLKSIQATK